MKPTFCTTEEMRRGYAFVPDEATVPLGTPLEGADVDLVEAEDGGAELVISGPGVGPGYLRTREGERDGYRAEGERRRYFTGDLVEQRHGKVFYRQRADAQVKLRGNRFELSEIESVLEQFGVTGAHAVAVGDRVVVLIDDRCDRTDDELLATLKEHVPAYAVPRLIIRLEAWPRNVNDKIDRAKLRELAQHRLENG